MRLTDRGRIVITILVTLIATIAIIVTSTASSSDGAVTPPAPTSSPKAVTAPIVDRTVPERPRIAQRPSRSMDRPRCLDRLGVVLHRAGFHGENLREAWAIAMRESNGRPTQVSNGVDVGLFQFNYPSHGDKPWWDWDLLLDADYNAKVAYRVSRGGRDWLHWGMTGDGQTNPALYGSWSSDQVWSWITEPYQRYYSQYPC